MSYISVLLDAKSIRERYIRVAAIVTIMEGNRNICVGDGFKSLTHMITTKNIRG